MRISSGLARLALDLLAQVADVDVDRAWLAVVGAPAEALEELPAGEDDAGVRGEQREQLELDERQLDGLAAHLDRAPRQVDARRRRGRSSPRAGRRDAAFAARRSSARTRLRNSRIENGFVM